MMTLEAFQAYLARHLAIKTGKAESAFGVESNLVADGLIDSLTFMSLLFFIENLTGAHMPDGDFDLSELNTIGKLYACFYREVGSLDSASHPRPQSSSR